MVFDFEVSRVIQGGCASPSVGLETLNGEFSISNIEISEKGMAWMDGCY